MSVTDSDPSRPEHGAREALVSPVIVTSILVIVAVLPLGLPSEARFVLPMLPYVAIHYWTLNERGLMPSIFVFMAGLAIDILTHGPLGYWSTVFLIGFGCARWLSGPISDTRIGRFVGYVLTCALLAALQWAIASLYFVRAADPQPFVLAASIATLYYPLLALLEHRPATREASGGGGRN
ncbi:MAG: hypothetical protein AAGG99_08380 [Pseudomonadota bacterium]